MGARRLQWGKHRVAPRTAAPEKGRLRLSLCTGRSGVPEERSWCRRAWFEAGASACVRRLDPPNPPAYPQRKRRMNTQDNRSSGRRRGPRRRRPQDESQDGKQHRNNGGYQGQQSGHSGSYRPSSRSQSEGRHSERQAETAKPSLLQRILSFFGFGPKKKTYPPYEGGKSVHPSQREGSQSGAPRRGGTPAGAAAVGGGIAAAGAMAAGAPSRPSRKPEAVEVTTPKLYVGNLSFDASESDISELFNGVGAVKNVEIVTYKDTYKSKGFGFVTMTAIDEAVRAVNELHDKEFMGRRLVVSGAKTNDRPQERPAAERAPEKPAEGVVPQHQE
jgi:hypothetical protein